MAYYRRIRDMREDHDLTQRQLAAILHMPQPLYTRYEQGLRDITTVTLVQLDLYDFFTIPARPYSIISRMISSLVSFMPSLPRRPMPLMVVSMSFITMPSPPLNS